MKAKILVIITIMFSWLMGSSAAVTVDVSTKIDVGPVVSFNAERNPIQDVELNVLRSTLEVVLSYRAYADLPEQDMKRYNMPESNTSMLPTYKRTPGDKNTELNGIVGMFYLSNYIFRSANMIDRFAKYNDPEQRGDVLGFQQRFTAGPITGNYIGAIYEQAAV